MKYRKKGSVVDAVQYSGHNGAFLREWAGSAIIEPVAIGDWVIRDDSGHYLVVPDVLFQSSYEPAL